MLSRFQRYRLPPFCGSLGDQFGTSYADGFLMHLAAFRRAVLGHIAVCTVVIFLDWASGTTLPSCEPFRLKPVFADTADFNSEGRGCMFLYNVCPELVD
jgi:hypothetical protein